MMISPETYYEMNLKGKTAEQIMSAIRGLKNEIGHLKNLMEHPDYGTEYSRLREPPDRRLRATVPAARSQVSVAECH